jgi:uncharacterized membrane protein (UPF0127 family)
MVVPAKGQYIRPEGDGRLPQTSEEQPAQAIRVENLTREQPLVTDGWVAHTEWARFRGLIGHRPLKPGQGLLIVPCSSIHTHFMSFPIDVIFVDESNTVVGMNEKLKPWRFGRLFRRVKYVIELPAGTIEQTGTEPSDQLQVEGYEI